MNNIKKCLFTFGFVLILVAACSLSAFAEDPDYIYNDPNFEPIVSPSYSGAEQDGVAYYNYSINDTVLSCVIHDTSNDSYYLLICRFAPTSNYPVSDFKFWLCSSNGSEGFRLNLCAQFLNSGVTSWTAIGGNFNCFVYDQNGTLVASTSNSCYFKYDEFTLLYQYALLNGPFEVFPVFNQYYGLTEPFIFDGSTITNRNIYYNNRNGHITSGAPTTWTFTPVEYCIPNSLGTGSYWTYTKNWGTGTGSVISGSVSGSVPDGQGGTQDVNFDINLDLPEYDGDIGTDEFPTMPQFDDSSLSVIDGGSALQWVYARVNDLVTTNQKVFALVTSCLSLGVIMLILNKRS